MKRFPIVLCFLLLAVCIPSSVAAAPRIAHVVIRSASIFDFELNPAIHKFPYTFINKLHITTNERVIRDEVLFKVGDELDPFLLRETERNLRALPFIRAARIFTETASDGGVTVFVNTQDAWTTEPLFNLGGINKVDQVEVGFREKNVLGMGKTIEFLYTHGKDFSERTYRYYDPHLLHSRWRLDGHLKQDAAGVSRSVQLDRPFYSVTTPWSVRALYDNEVEIVDQYANNQKISRFSQQKEINEYAVATKIGGGKDFVVHAGPRYRRESQFASAVPETTQALPPSQHYQTIFADLDLSHTNFLELTKIEKMSRIEDVNLGPQIQVSPGLSPKYLTGSEDTLDLTAGFQQKFWINEQHLFSSDVKYSGRDPFNDPENQLYNAKIKYHNRFSDMQTWVFQGQLQWGDHLDPDNLIKLGGNTGLRAYKNDEFVGNRSLQFNAEDRLFFVDDAFSLVSVGAAAFFDSGTAWPQERPVSLSALNSDIGVGLRFGLTRSSNEVVVRLDIAYRLNPASSSDARYVVTFGTGQAF